MKQAIVNYFFHKYMLPNDEWHPFGDLEFELSFIPVQFHSMYRRVSEWEEPCLSAEDLYGDLSSELPF
jgi:hypothetical protein